MRSKPFSTLLQILSITCISLTLPPPTLAKDIDGEFIAFSVGTGSCKNYLAARQAGGSSFQTYKDWLSGYLSAFNLIVANTYDIVGKRRYKQLIRWVDRYCNKNQQQAFVNAAAQLTVKLFPSRLNLAPNKNTSAKWNGNRDSTTSPTIEKGR